VIKQGNVYWCSVQTANGTTTTPHPYVVIQDTVINQSRIDTVVVCGITTNMKKATWPGYIVLESREANLTQRSIIDVSQVSVIQKSQLGDYIGEISASRLSQLFSGMKIIQSLQGQSS
jgi:mRNA interferase MazF